MNDFMSEKMKTIRDSVSERPYAKSLDTIADSSQSIAGSFQEQVEILKKRVDQLELEGKAARKDVVVNRVLSIFSLIVAVAAIVIDALLSK